MPIVKTANIILLSTETHVALPVIRALGSVIPSYVSLSTLTSKNNSIYFPQFSRYIKKHYQVSSNDEDKFCEELCRISRNGPAILLPLDEYYTRLLSVLQSRLKDHFYLPPLPSPAIFDKLVNKNRLCRYLQEHHFPGPHTISLADRKVQELDDNFFPCILKPERGSSGRGIKKVNSLRSLKNCMARHNKDKYILQEFIPGQDIDCSLIAENGEVKAITVQRGIESSGFSFSTAIKFERNEKVLATAEKLVRKTDYSGVAHLDFRLDNRDGQPKLIDFNARFWLSLLGSKAAGVNFAFLYCLAALGIPFEKPEVKEITYMMGKSTFNYYYQQGLKFRPASKTNTYSDLWGRIRDPLPEVIKLIHP